MAIQEEQAVTAGYVQRDGCWVGFHNEGGETFVNGGNHRLDQRTLEDRRPLFVHHGQDANWPSSTRYEILFDVTQKQIWTTTDAPTYHALLGYDDATGWTLTKPLQKLIAEGYRWFILYNERNGEDESFLVPANQVVRTVKEIDNTASKHDVFISSLEHYRALVRKVRQAQADYHTKDTPTISDYDYDQLVSQLKKIEDEHPEWVEGVSVTESVGATPKRGLYPVKHSSPMLSLDNVFTVAELQDKLDAWGDAEIHTSYKYDGLACRLTYLNQRLVEAASRGDRYVGESILHNIVGFDSVPKSLQSFAPDRLEVSGELLMFTDEFDRYNERLSALGRPPAINPRNAAAGIARRLDRERLPGAQLVFFPYAVLYPDGDGPDNFNTAMEQLHKNGFEMPWLPEQFHYDSKKPLELVDYIDRRQKERDTLPFGIDGLVLRVVDYALCEKLGFTSRAPRWAVAYKFPPEEKSTVVRNIRLQIGRTGNATPVAEVDPVLVGGVTVTNATLHNEDHIKRLDIAIGDTVMIRRAGDVVPEIGAVLHRPNDRVVWTFPEMCECGNPIVRPEGQANHICTGRYTCRFQRQRGVEHFVSRDAMDIDGVGPELLADLMTAGKLKSPSDLYRLTRNDLLSVSSDTSERFAENILQSIKKSRKTTLARFIYALGIPHVGLTTAKRLADWFGSFAVFRRAGATLLRTVPDIGIVVADAIIDYFKSHDEDKLLLGPGGVELIDEMGPAPEFATYANILELLKKAELKGLTQRKYLEVIEKLGRYFNWPYGKEVHHPKLPEEDEWLRTFYLVYRDKLEGVAKDHQLVQEALPHVRKINNNQPLAGNTYVITGSFDETLGSRTKIASALQALGAKVVGSVSAKTTAVLVGDSPGNNKLDKAKELAVPTLFVNELSELLSKHSQ